MLQVAAASHVWDSPVIIAFLTVTVPLLIGQWAQRRGAHSDAKTLSAQTTAQSVQLSSIKETGLVTHTIVNSQKTAMEEAINTLKAQIISLGGQPAGAAPVVAPPSDPTSPTLPSTAASPDPVPPPPAVV